MKIWIVIDWGDDGDRITAIYDSPDLANEHAEALGLHVEEHELLSEIMPMARDEEAKRKVQIEAEEARQARLAREEHWARHHDSVQSRRIENYGKPSICSCAVFTTPRWTEHGFCSYCGGWSPQVLFNHLGYTALYDAIDSLDSHRYRERMRQIVDELGICEWPEEIG